MKAPDRHVLQTRCQLLNQPSRFTQLRKAADGYHSSETIRVLRGEQPGTVSAQRKAGEIEAIGIAAVLSRRNLQTPQGHLSHRPDPRRLRPALRHDDDGWNRAVVPPNCAPQPDLGLQQAVVAALAAAVQEQDHGPGLLRRVIGRDVYAVGVAFLVNRERLVEKPRRRRPRVVSRLLPGGRERKRKRTHQLHPCPCQHVSPPASGPRRHSTENSASSSDSSRSRWAREASHSSLVTITSRAWLPLYSPTIPASYIWSIRRDARP